jgi:hypothetical protein
MIILPNNPGVDAEIIHYAYCSTYKKNARILPRPLTSSESSESSPENIKKAKRPAAFADSKENLHGLRERSANSQNIIGQKFQPNMHPISFLNSDGNKSGQSYTLIKITTDFLETRF